ncbi:phosphatase PAP2 family protein [soil metagenome]
MISVSRLWANSTPRQPPVAMARVLPGAVVSTLLVVAMGVFLRVAPSPNAAEQAVTIWFNGARTGVIGGITTAVYDSLEPIFAVIITALLAVTIWIVTRRLRLAITFAVVVAATWLPIAVFKFLFLRARPDALLLPHPVTPAPFDASYPSGHVAFVTALAMAFVLIAGTFTKRVVTIVLGALAVILVALSVLIDGVHFPTDVIASIVWGVGIAPLVWHIWRRLTDSIGSPSSS